MITAQSLEEPITVEARAIRKQDDGLNGEYSFMTGLDCSNLPDVTRQEFKDESDVNKVLARYGVDGIIRPPQYAEIDYDMDLQQSLEAIQEAERAIAKLPPDLRSKYNTWDRLFDGAHNGNFKADLTAHYAAKEAETAAAAQAALDKANPPA